MSGTKGSHPFMMERVILAFGAKIIIAQKGRVRKLSIWKTVSMPSLGAMSSKRLCLARGMVEARGKVAGRENAPTAQGAGPLAARLHLCAARAGTRQGEAENAPAEAINVERTSDVIAGAAVLGALHLPTIPITTMVLFSDSNSLVPSPLSKQTRIPLPIRPGVEGKG